MLIGCCSLSPYCSAPQHCNTPSPMSAETKRFCIEYLDTSTAQCDIPASRFVILVHSVPVHWSRTEKKILHNIPPSFECLCCQIWLSLICNARYHFLCCHAQPSLARVCSDYTTSGGLYRACRKRSCSTESCLLVCSAMYAHTYNPRVLFMRVRPKAKSILEHKASFRPYTPLSRAMHQIAACK